MFELCGGFRAGGLLNPHEAELTWDVSFVGSNSGCGLGVHSWLRSWVPLLVVVFSYTPGCGLASTPGWALHFHSWFCFGFQSWFWSSVLQLYSFFKDFFLSESLHLSTSLWAGLYPPSTALPLHTFISISVFDTWKIKNPHVGRFCFLVDFD